MLAIGAEVFESNVIVGPNRGKLQVSLRDGTGVLPGVTWWSTDMALLGLNFTELQSLWATCDDENGKEAGRFLNPLLYNLNCELNFPAVASCCPRRFSRR